MKKFICLILCLVFLFSVPFNASAYEVNGFEVTAENAMLISLDTNEILYSKGEDEKIYPAGITQLMTAAVVLDAFPDVLNSKITMTQSAYNKILGTGSVVLNAKVGEEFIVRDALACMLLSSTGDIAYACAEAVSGSIEAFVEKMNEKAAEIGLENTRYQNPIGLHSEENYTTVSDIRILCEYIFKNCPVISEIAAKPRYKMAATNMGEERLLVTTNYMIDSNTSYYYPYCTGLKTGVTDSSGGCLVSTAKYEGYNYLCIAMNCPLQNGAKTEFTTSKKLFKWAFTEFKFKAVLDMDMPISEIPVRLSKENDYVSLYPGSQVKSILPKQADSSSIIIEPHLKGKSVDAPVKKGDVMGTADVIFAERVIGTVELIAGNDVKSNKFLVVADMFRKIFTSLAFKIIIVAVILIALLLTVYVIKLNSKGREKKRVVKFVPYSDEKEIKRREKLAKRRKQQGRPEYKQDETDNKDNL